MLLISYKKVIKGLPEFELTIDKRNLVVFETKLDTILRWKGAASIQIKEENEDGIVSISVIRKDVKVLETIYRNEEEAYQNLYAKIDDLKQIVELDSIFAA